MSSKNKYFEVTSKTIVSAINMKEARRAASARSKVPSTEVLGRSTEVERLYAKEAKTIAESFSIN